MKIRLEQRNSAFVVEMDIAVEKPSDVIVWDDRIFHRINWASAARRDGPAAVFIVYREATVTRLNAEGDPA